MTKLAVDATGAPVPVVALSGTDTVSFTGTSAQSDAVPAGVNVVRVCTTAACFVEFGLDPTATTASHFLFANSENFIRIEPLNKMAFIQESEAGTAYISYVN